MPQTLNASRIRLRSPVASDARAIFQSYTQDPEVCGFMIWRPHASELVTQAFIASCVEDWQAGSRLPYVIAELHSNIAIGMLEARVQGTTVDIGYVLGKSHWGKGYMPEAIQAFTDVVLQGSSVYRVQAACDTENIPFQRALEKSGFSREGRLERYTVHPNISSEPRACFMYARCR